MSVKKIDYIEILNINKIINLLKKKLNIKIFFAYYLGSTRLIFLTIIHGPKPKNDKKPITSVIVVTKTLEAKAGSILNFFKDTGLIFIPATIMFNIIYCNQN